MNNKLPDCTKCKGEMYRASVAFIKCEDKQCTESHFGIRHSEAKPVRGVDHLLTKRVNHVRKERSG